MDILDVDSILASYAPSEAKFSIPGTKDQDQDSEPDNNTPLEPSSMRSISQQPLFPIHKSYPKSSTSHQPQSPPASKS